MTTFRNLLSDRAAAFGWDKGNGDILEYQVNGTPRNLVDHFGLIPLQEIKNEVMTYYNQPTRRAQNSFAMYHCIMNSVTEATINKLTIEAKDYKINGTPCGPLLFKVLMQMSTVDTRVTVAHVRANLASLDSYIGTVNSNIDKFNQYVKEQLDVLEGRGETTHDLLVNLFKAYQCASDQHFCKWAERKKDEYDEGGNITSSLLMEEANKKYETLKLENKWNALSPDQEQLVALAAEMKQLRDKKLTFDKDSDIAKENRKTKLKENVRD